MSTAPEKATPAVEPTFNGQTPDAGRRVGAAGADAPAADQMEAQLRARIAMLQRQLAEVANCLEAAETRAARVPSLEAKIAEYKATRSWRYTEPLRVGGRYLRRWLGR